MLDALRGRRGDTTVVWVRAHAGDIGNELAGARVGAGIWSDNERWDRDTHPIEMYSTETGDMVSLHGWNTAAERTETEHYCRFTRERLMKEGEAYSTDSLVRGDRGGNTWGTA